MTAFFVKEESGMGRPVAAFNSARYRMGGLDVASGFTPVSHPSGKNPPTKIRSPTWTIERTSLA